MIATPQIAPLSLDQYVPLLGAAEVEELRTLAGPLEGKIVDMVNSTAVGGGVAEILNRLIPLARELGLDARWHVMEGGPEFYDITKAFHNALHGNTYTVRPRDFEIFLDYNRRNRERMPLDGRFVVIHDPQPAAFIDTRPLGDKQTLDLALPYRSFASRPGGMEISSSLSSPAMMARYSRRRSFRGSFPFRNICFIRPLTRYRTRIAIWMPISSKTCWYASASIQRRPILTQISRFDRLKDPLGVLRAYRIVKRYFDCQLVLAGGGAADDPEGSAVLAEVREAAGNDPDIHSLSCRVAAPLEVNALQRASTVVIQKSLREGFGLTVAEALWKKKPVVASAVGGIPTQVIHKHTGLLAHSVEGTAYQIRFLLAHPDIAQRLGEQGHEHVRENFLITGNLKRYLTLFLHQIGDRNLLPRSA